MRKRNTMVGRWARQGLVAGWVVCLVASGAHAANIQWSNPSNITPGPAGDADVSLNGTLLGAFNVGGSSTTLNGVLFDIFPVGNPTNTVGNFTLSNPTQNIINSGGGSAQAPFINLSSAYQSLLGDSVRGNNQSSVSLTLNGLSVGGTYQLQVWVNDSANFIPPGFTFKTVAKAGNEVEIDPNTSLVEGGLGQYAIGTFVADASSQQVLFNNDEIGGRLNGFQLRQVVPASERPVPTTSGAGLAVLAALLFGAAGLTLRRQRLN